MCVPTITNFVLTNETAYGEQIGKSISSIYRQDQRESKRNLNLNTSLEPIYKREILKIWHHDGRDYFAPATEVLNPTQIQTS